MSNFGLTTISKTFRFSASHCLEDMPEGHPCKRLHGHNYSVTLGLAKVLKDGETMVLDYREMWPFQDLIEDELDHRHLNDTWDCKMPTAEWLAKTLFIRAKLLFEETAYVTVKEGDDTSATYTQALPLI